MRALTPAMTTQIGMLAIKYRKNKLNKISSERTSTVRFSATAAFENTKNKEK